MNIKKFGNHWNFKNAKMREKNIIKDRKVNFQAVSRLFLRKKIQRKNLEKIVIVWDFDSFFT